MEHWLFGTSSHRHPVSTLFPSGELRNEEQTGVEMPSTLLGPEEAAASQGADSADAVILPLLERLIPSGGCKIKVSDTACHRGSPDGDPRYMVPSVS